jgi:DNA-binding transcriptional MerR regulator
MADDDNLDLAELGAKADVSARTVRYYIQQGLLPAPETRGPGAHYGPEHLDRLNLIRHLQREHLPLAEIRRRIEKLSPREIRRVLEQTPKRSRTAAADYIRSVLQAPTASYTSPTDSAVSRSQWDRIILAPDVELHVRRPLAREQNRQVERLLEAARTIYGENTP